MADEEPPKTPRGKEDKMLSPKPPRRTGDQPAWDIFISYNPQNSWAQCCCLALELRKIGIKVWFDMATDVSKGGSVRGMDNCKSFVLFLNDKTMGNTIVQDDVTLALKTNKTILIVHETDVSRGAVFTEDGSSFDFFKTLYEQAPTNELKEMFTQWKDNKINTLAFARSHEEDGVARMKLIVQMLTQSGLSHDSFFLNKKEQQAAVTSDAKFDFSIVFNPEFSSDRVDVLRLDLEQLKFLVDVVHDKLTLNITKSRAIIIFLTKNCFSLQPIQDAIRFGVQMKLPTVYVYETDARYGACFTENGVFDFETALGQLLISSAHKPPPSPNSMALFTSAFPSKDSTSPSPPLPPSSNLIDLKLLILDAVPFYRRFRYRKNMIETILIDAGFKPRKYLQNETPLSPSSAASPSSSISEKTLQNIDPSLLHIGGCIGQGSFGKVLEGKWKRVRVAIKEVPGTLDKLLEQEGELLARQHHVNIMRVFGTTTPTPDQVCLVLEHVSGGSLHDLLHQSTDKSKPLLPMDWVLAMLFDIAEGIDYLHNQSPRAVYHRDLRTKNILVRPNYQLVVSHIWRHNEKAASFRYWPPELISASTNEFNDPDNKRLCLPRAPTDIYGFSMIMYELITGKIPFNHMTNNFIKEAVVDRQERPDLTQFASEFPERYSSSLVVLMKQCWSHDPLARPDISDILRILVRLLKVNDGDPRDNRMDTIPKEYQLLLIDEEVEAAKMDEETSEWLEKVDCGRFIGNFCDYGIQTLYDLSCLCSEDPTALTTTIGMKSLQAKKFKDLIRQKKPPPKSSPPMRPGSLSRTNSARRVVSGGGTASNSSPPLTPRGSKSPQRPMVAEMDPAAIEWLEVTGGSKFADAFAKHGCKNMDDLVYMAFEEPHEFVNSIGMKQIQASKFKDMLTNESHPKSPRVSIRKTISLRMDGNINRDRILTQKALESQDRDKTSPQLSPQAAEDEEDEDMPRIILEAPILDEAPKVEPSNQDTSLDA